MLSCLCIFCKTISSPLSAWWKMLSFAGRAGHRPSHHTSNREWKCLGSTRRSLPVSSKPSYPNRHQSIPYPLQAFKRQAEWSGHDKLDGSFNPPYRFAVLGTGMVLSLLALLFTIAVVRVVQDVGICHTSISNSYMDFFPEGKWDGIEDFLRWNQVCKVATHLLANFHFHSICNSPCSGGKKMGQTVHVPFRKKKIKQGASLLSADLHFSDLHFSL